MKLKTRITLDANARLFVHKPVYVMARHAAEQLENFIINNPEIIHDVTTVGDVSRKVSSYVIDISIKDKHDPA